MSADKYPSIFSCQMEAIVYIYNHKSLPTLDSSLSLLKGRLGRIFLNKIDGSV